MYGRDSLTLDDVQSILYSRVLQKNLEIKSDIGEGLAIRDRP